MQQMFGVFDKNADGFIDRDEFKFCWNYWIKTVSYGVVVGWREGGAAKQHAISGYDVRLVVDCLLVIPILLALI